MKRTILTFLLIVTATSALAAGTLTPVGATQTPIQIKEHLVDVVIDNGFARTEVTQTFFNPNSQDLEAVYGFPVPTSASLSEITIWSGENVLNGEVIEAKEATRVYTEERDAGNDAGLGECACTKEKDGVEYSSYKFSIAKVKAQAETKIRFVYYQPLKIDTGVGRYVYPLEEGGTDEVAKSFWTRNPKVEQHFAVNVELKSGWPVDEVRAPGAESEAKVTKLAEGHYKLAIDRAGGDLSKDFVFYYRLADNLPGRVELLAYKPDAKSTGTFMLTVTPGVDLAPLTGGADYVFVLDVSGSMSGKLATLARGVQQTLGQFKAGDRFRIVKFSDSAQELTHGFVDATPESVKEWSERVARLSPEGGTDVYGALQAGFNAVEADRATSILLVTDGVTNTGIVDPKEFHKLLKQHDVRVFGFLMGNNANWPLMRLVAETSGGFYTAVSNDDDIIGAILLAKDKIRSEALHDAKLTIDGVQTAERTDQIIGKIYRGQQLVIFGRYDQPGNAKVTLQAKLTGKDETYTTNFEFPAVATEHPELERMWALDRIEQNVMQEVAGLLPPAESESAIRDLGVQYQLVTDYTSMVVLGDDTFTKRGIARNNKQRIEVERAAQAQRASAPPVNRRVDTKAPMYGGSSHGLRGGGAFDPFTVLLAIGAALAAAFGVKRS
ncbi:MAG: Ca-activated chloride channel [Acidobacteriota bacterium]|jgi:Ca-activated chloride channel family protein|nr:Ca-activated chloride channel [Acidobacteriota bacterium]